MKASRLVKRDLIKPPNRFHHGQLREAVIAATSKVVERDGHLAVSLRSIAEALGVTQPAIYRHFANKEEILAEVSAAGMRQFLVAISEALDSDPDPITAIEAAGRAYVRFGFEHPGWFRLCFSRVGSEQLTKHPVVQAAMMAAGAAYMSKMFATLAKIVPPGTQIPDAYRAFWALAHGLTSFVVERVFQLVDTDEARIATADAALAVFVGAYRKPSSPPAR